jgi:hypothetical protein
MLEAAIPSGFGGLKGVDCSSDQLVGRLSTTGKKVKKVARIRADAVW